MYLLSQGVLDYLSTDFSGLAAIRDARMGYYFTHNRITELIIRLQSIRTNVFDQFSKPHPLTIR